MESYFKLPSRHRDEAGIFSSKYAQYAESHGEEGILLGNDLIATLT